MTISAEIRKLAKKWATGGWPKRLEWIEISGLRGWTGQRLDLSFPFVAIVGENGSGKSSVLQSMASVYRSKETQDTYYASDFFPDTAWESISNASIKYSVREGANSASGSIRKPTSRWKGNPERKERDVRYIDLRRLQPISTQIGYGRLAKANIKETHAASFGTDQLKRLSAIIGKKYDLAKHSLTDADAERRVPVVRVHGIQYSGFHQGAGEMVVADLLKADLPKYSLLLVDEIETSLHPRAQRRLVRELAEIARVNELQVVVTTHSPYVLEELPAEARVYIMSGASGRQIVTGVSPYFAMTQMDEDAHPELDLYVEDTQAAILMSEILARHNRDLLRRTEIIPYGAANVGRALGTMVKGDRFPRPTRVVLDGDQEAADGCILLPGDDAPEPVVFGALKSIGWVDIASKIGRSHSELVDSAERSMTQGDHHDWVRTVADDLVVGGDALWRAMCFVWVEKCLAAADAKALVESLEDALE